MVSVGWGDRTDTIKMTLKFCRRCLSAAEDTLQENQDMAKLEIRIQREGEGMHKDVSGEGQGEFPMGLECFSWSSFAVGSEVFSTGAVQMPWGRGAAGGTLCLSDSVWVVEFSLLRNL